MIYKCEKNLKPFRVAGRCEWCGVWLSRREAHHVMRRGSSGGTRLDIPENLMGLCPTFMGNNCHDRFGNDPRCRPRFLEILAKREGFASGEAVWDWLNMLLGLPKGSAIPERVKCAGIQCGGDPGPGR